MSTKIPPATLAPLNNVSVTLKSHASWRSFLIAFAAFFASYAFIQRSSDLFSFFVGANTVSTRVFLSPSIFSSNAFGYTPATFIDAFGNFAKAGFGTAFSRLIYAGIFLLNFVPIGLSGFLLSVFVSSGVDALDTVPAIASYIPKEFSEFLPLANLIPVLSASFDAIENAMLLFGLIFLGPVGSTNAFTSFFVALATTVNFVKSIYVLVNYCLVTAAFGIFAFKWTNGIGRDGRQKVEVKKAN
ncbi:hypothetical protein HK098_006258 [Nowakowskiella sp. JEL0407]|nr:hypothetical protein HK098_006258 [Nowakowskiella sp. JEL0407]